MHKRKLTTNKCYDHAESNRNVISYHPNILSEELFYLGDPINYLVFTLALRPS